MLCTPQSAQFLLAAWLLFGGDRAPDLLCEFSTPEYIIRMQVSFFPPYEGKRLAVYSNRDPRKEICLAGASDPSGCAENFVGAVAIALFTVTRVADGRPAAASIREVVTVLDQSPGLPKRPQYAVTIKLNEGTGTDLQVFGYDESPLPPAKRAAERETAKAAWRRYRQELYLDQNQQPFAVIEWLHTTTSIRVARVETPPPPVTRKGPSD